jgi:hypothetical protein
MSGGPTPDRDEDRSPGSDAPAPGVELGMSDEAGGTFEPEEDPDEDAGREG